MSFPIGSMYGIFTYIWLIFMVNVGKYTIHGSFGFGGSYRSMTQKYLERYFVLKVYYEHHIRWEHRNDGNQSS